MRDADVRLRGEIETLHERWNQREDCGLANVLRRAVLYKE
jgi:hypothetical protein